MTAGHKGAPGCTGLGEVGEYREGISVCLGCHNQVRLGGLNERLLLSYDPPDQAPLRLVSGRATSWLAACSHGVSSGRAWRELSGVFPSLYKNTNPTRSGLALMTSFSLIVSLRALSPIIVTLGIGAATYDLGGEGGHCLVHNKRQEPAGDCVMRVCLCRGRSRCCPGDKDSGHLSK